MAAAGKRFNMPMRRATASNTMPSNTTQRVAKPGSSMSPRGILVNLIALTVIGCTLAIGFIGAGAHAAQRVKQANKFETRATGSAETLDAATSLPPMPPPHPRRAGAARRAAYARLLATWPSGQPKQSGQARPVVERADRAPGSETATAQPSRSSSKPPTRPDAGRDRTMPTDSARTIDPPTPTARQAVLPSGGKPAPADTGDKDVTHVDTPADKWTAEEIAQAEQSCESLLDGVAAEADRLEPLRQGSCGTPKPLRLRRIGSGAGTEIEPAATTNCALTARFYQWLETVAQPAAKRAFGSRIVKVRNASSYMCRNRYNDPAQKISEHAFANALDVAAFELADGRLIDVKRYWGLVVESTQAARAAETEAAAKATSATGATTKPEPAKPGGIVRRAITSGISQAKAEGKSQPAEPVANETAELAFLKELHSGACGIFSTVLGPQANRAHHDHFHFDLKQRRGAAYCE